MFKVQTFEPRTLIWWNDESEHIDMNPSYQRKGKIWSVFDKAYLIDSILNSFDVPKIYIADFTYGYSVANKQRKKYAVIDGKQRLEAIFGYFNNDFPLNPDCVYLEDEHIAVGGLYYYELVEKYPKIARKLQNASLQFMSVITDEESKINELFLRLNRSRTLNSAEIRNAMKGKAPALIRDLAEHSFFKKHIKLATGRGQDWNLAAKLLLLELNGKLADTGKKHLDEMVVESSQLAETDHLDATIYIIKKRLDYMCLIFVEKDGLLNSQGMIILYYWLVRSSPPRTHKYLREFINHFQMERKAAQKNKKTNIDNIEAEYLRFDALNKHVSTKSSLESMFIILIRNFAIYYNAASEYNSK